MRIQLLTLLCLTVFLFLSCNRGPAKLDIPEPEKGKSPGNVEVQPSESSVPSRIAVENPHLSTCLEAAYDIAMATDFFQAMIKADPNLSLMEDTQAEGDVYDFRVYEDHEEHTVTVARMRVDMAQQKVYEYDVVNDKHVDLHAPGKLFEDYPFK